MNKPKVKELSPTLFKVLNYSVKIQTKKGRKLLLCSCQNHSRFCNENPFCLHKQLVLEYINLKDIKNKINKLIKEYENYSNLKLNVSPEAMLNDLKNLK